MPSLYFYDVWLWLYNFSKLRKIGVILAVSNYRVFQIVVNYVICISRIAMIINQAYASFEELLQAINSCNRSMICRLKTRNALKRKLGWMTLPAANLLDLRMKKKGKNQKSFSQRV